MLAQRILQGLRTDSRLGSLLPTVDINVAQGRVILQGVVQNEQQRAAIESVVRQATGGSNVEDQLQVQGGAAPVTQ
jgi:osmotically-inducible protein OsmY